MNSGEFPNEFSDSILDLNTVRTFLVCRTFRIRLIPSRHLLVAGDLIRRYLLYPSSPRERGESKRENETRVHKRISVASWLAAVGRNQWETQGGRHERWCPSTINPILKRTLFTSPSIGFNEFSDSAVSTDPFPVSDERRFLRSPREPFRNGAR